MKTGHICENRFFSALPTPAEMALWDASAIREYRIPEFTLMENASREAFHVLSSLIEPEQRVLVFMGGGNNGGDGAALARHLHDAGHPVLVCHTHPLSRMRGTAKAHCLLAKRCGVPFTRIDADETGVRFHKAWHSFAGQSQIIVDALLGTGFTGELRARERTLVGHINSFAARAVIFSLDIPSGLNGLTGLPRPEAVRAHATVTFEAAKPGLCLPEAAEYIGALHVRPIGIPLAVRERHPPSFRLMAPPPGSRPKASPFLHKGGAGRVLVIGGSEEFTGAPLLAALGALRAGAGLVTIACPAALASAIKAGRPEVMALPLGTGSRWSSAMLPELTRVLEELPEYSAVVLGPGIGRSAQAMLIVRTVLELAKRPALVLDADGLFLLNQKRDTKQNSVWEALREGDMLTPHPGEAARLLGWSTEQVQGDRPAALRSLTKLCAAAIVLKGAGTLVGQNDAPLALAPFATAALAVGGSGDVLAGVCAAYRARGEKAFMAACLGVYTHGKAGEFLESEYPYQGNFAAEIAEAIAKVSW